MSNPLEEARGASRRMHEARTQHRAAVQEAASAKRAYKVAYAKALLKATTMETLKTVDERRAIADLETHEELFQHELAQGLQASALEAVRNRRTDVDLWRSFISAAKEGVAVEWAMAGEM